MFIQFNGLIMWFDTTWLKQKASLVRMTLCNLSQALDSKQLQQVKTDEAIIEK